GSLQPSGRLFTPRRARQHEARLPESECRMQRGKTSPPVVHLHADPSVKRCAPKEIPLEFIGTMNRDLIRAAWRRTGNRWLSALLYNSHSMNTGRPKRGGSDAHERGT